MEAEFQRPLHEGDGNAQAGEGDDAIGQQVQQRVVAPERCGTSMAVPVRLAPNLVHAVALGPLRGNAFDAGAAAARKKPSMH